MKAKWHLSWIHYNKFIIRYKEIEHRIRFTGGSFAQHRKLLENQNIHLKTQVIILNCLIKSILSYDAMHSTKFEILFTSQGVPAEKSLYIIINIYLSYFYRSSHGKYNIWILCMYPVVKRVTQRYMNPPCRVNTYYPLIYDLRRRWPKMWKSY